MANINAKEDMFSLEDKLSALETLKKNDYSYEVTSQKIGVKAATLKTWAKELMPMMDAESGSVLEVINATDDDLEVEYDRTVREVRTLMLQKIRTIIPEEKDLDKITRTLKLLHDISSQGVWAGSKDRGQKNWYTQVNQTIYKVQSDPAIVKKITQNGN
jgi:transposase-like protein